ncbi:unnamed protein product, partial [Sphagnum balticum]
KVAQHRQVPTNPQDLPNMQIEANKKNLYNNLVFDSLVRKQLEEAHAKENRLKSIKKLRRYANVIRGAMMFVRLGKLGIKKKMTMMLQAGQETKDPETKSPDSKTDLFRSRRGSVMPKPRMSLRLPFGELFVKKPPSKSRERERERERDSARSKDEKRSARYNDPQDPEDSKNFTLLPKIESNRNGSLLKSIKPSNLSARANELILSARANELIKERKIEFPIKESDSGDMDVVLSPKEDGGVPL